MSLAASSVVIPVLIDYTMTPVHGAPVAVGDWRQWPLHWIHSGALDFYAPDLPVTVRGDLLPTGPNGSLRLHAGSLVAQWSRPLGEEGPVTTSGIAMTDNTTLISAPDTGGEIRRIRVLKEKCRRNGRDFEVLLSRAAAYELRRAPRSLDVSWLQAEEGEIIDRETEVMVDFAVDPLQVALDPRQARMHLEAVLSASRVQPGSKKLLGDY